MTENELIALKDLPAPLPRAEAKSAALAAALAAFDAGEKNNPDASKGTGETARLTHALQAKRRQPMRVSTVSMKMAASLAALTVGTVGMLYFAGPRVSLRMASEQSGARTAQELVGGRVETRRPDQETSIDRILGPYSGQPIPVPPPSAGLVEAMKGRAPDSADNPLIAQRLELGLERSASLDGVPRRVVPDRKAAAAQEAGATYDSAPAMPADRLQNRDTFEGPAPNPVKQVAAEPVSTFSIDVDTASYAFARRAINAGHLPPKDAVRVEEMINYFPYAYARPEAADAPFQPSVTVMPAPWKPGHKLVHIGIKGYELVQAERPRANLVFLIDVSGSMASADRLPLVKNAFRLMLDELKPEDTVGIVTYASGSGIALEPTKVSDKGKILDALDALGAGGSTAGARGLTDAYRLAEAHYDKDGVNRIILATDGDFNVGISNRDELKGFVERKRNAGIFLSILGVGQGNYNDALTQALAQNGNGNAAYVDTLNEARKVLVDEASSTLFTIARDVKIQVEFNPAQVSEYRLIGYETRSLKREDFNNDKVDAGDVGSGHTVTAIYEITPKGAPKLVDDLRYGAPGAGQPAAEGQGGEYGFLKLRYKLPKEDASKLVTLPITAALETSDIVAAPEDVRFSVAVAGFGQLLRGLPYLGNYNYDDVLTLGQQSRGADPYGYRAEFLNMVRLAKSARP